MPNNNTIAAQMSSNEISLAPPRGMRDFYPEDMSVRNAIFDAWRQASNAHCFENYDACVVESLELLKRKAGEEISDQLYTFIDKSGRDLALRAEMTPTLARMIAAKQGSLSMPVKWWTIAQCFRYERMTRGRKREHYQWNLDIIGEESMSAEAEVISTALTSLSLLGIKSEMVKVHFNSRKLLGDLLAALQIPPEHFNAIFMALDKRGKTADDEISTLLVQAGLNKETIDKVFSLFKITSLDEAMSIVGNDKTSVKAMLDFRNCLSAYDINDHVVFDIGVIRGLSYYTGIVFEAYDTERKFRAIFGGGRYDNLLGDIGGKPATAVGLGFGDVVIAEIMQEKGLNASCASFSAIAIGFMEESQRMTAMKIAASMRSKGMNVDMSTRPEKPKAFFSRTGSRNHIKEAVYIGPDDIAKGKYRIKDLSSRTEREIPIE